MSEFVRYVIPALLLVGGNIIVQLIISSKQQKVQDVKLEAALAKYEAVNDKNIEVIQRDIKRLEEKQDKYNHLQERTVILERDLKTAFNRIDDLKEGK